MKFNPSIQGLRGLAACSVLIVHFYDMPVLAHFIPPVARLFDRSVVSFGHGVEIFFVISGYLIPQSLIRHRTLSKFFYDRALRILPLFVILHIIVFTAGPLVGYKFFKGIDVWTYTEIFAANLFFAADLFNLPLAQQNAWTLTYEWLFYIWFALIYYVTVSQPNRAAQIVMIGLGLVALWFRPAACYFLLGYVFSRTSAGITVKGWLGMSLALLCIAALYFILQYLPAWCAVAGLLPAWAFFGMALEPESGFYKFLSTAPLRFLGKISYSLYLVHPFALFPFQMTGSYLAARGFNLWGLWLGFIAAGGCVSIIMATITYELIEVRLRELIVRALSGDRKPQEEATAG